MLEINHAHETAVAPLLLAGVPERYPKIRFGWIESGCTWVPKILDECDMYFHGAVDDPAHKLQMLPTEQWRQSCFTAGPLSAADVATRERVGVETICFGSDFIHVEGTYPHSRKRLTKVLAGVSPEDRYAICTGNGARILGLDLDKLAKTKSAEQAWAF
jgi:predicted TIM-barrel fold metal-dependent hydrolase